ncbi:MAG: hypothetical protein R3B49_05700 [Phycisphaerales bacterium]
MQAISSTAPDAPRQCPCMDLVELISTLFGPFFARSPKTQETARSSAASPSGVDVPCALM